MEGSLLQAAGLVWKEVFPWIWNILLSLPSPRKLNCNICDCDALLHCCIAAIPCVCVRARMSKTFNCLPTSRTRLSTPSTHRDSRIQKRTRFVGAGSPLATMYLWKAVIAKHPATVCLAFARPAKTKKQTSKQWSMVSG